MSEAPAVIPYEDFAKVDLRIGQIRSAEPHPNADKLVVLQVDLGGAQRQLIAGIRGYYEPADLVGRQIVVVANLAPRMMRGRESQGMLLAACSDDRSSVILVSPEKPSTPGNRVS
jgi:methionyl-tRNA synthetase